MTLKLGKATREAYGEVLVEIGERYPEVVVLDADLSKSTMTKYFAQKFPHRFFNMGIAEANMVGVAAGLASCGKIPFISSFACFLLCKGYDQLRIAVAYSELNVKVVASHGGISIGEDGVSQMSVEDYALACALPGFVVMVPADEVATKEAVRRAVEHKGPVYLRVGRPKVPIVYEGGCDFRIGKAIQLRDGQDITLLANGLMVAAALEAAEILAGEGISARVIDMHTLKPLDEETLMRCAEETGAFVVAEEHLESGGLGSRVAMALARLRPTPCSFVNLDDTYAESGKPELLMEKYGLTAQHIAQSAREVLERKTSSLAELRL